MKCFYHSADLDGHCSGAIVKYRHPECECELIGINYGQDFPWDSIQDERVFMVDFCLQPFSDMIRLNSMCKLYWIDHHKTAIESADMFGFSATGGQCLEDGRAGCELTWDYIYSSNTPLAVTLLGRYDVWDHTDERTLPFQYGMRLRENTYPDNTELWKALFTDDSICDSIIADGRLIIDYETSQNKKFCDAYAFETKFLNGMTAICVNRGFCDSKLFESVYDPEKHHLMISFVRMRPPRDQWKVSLYTTRDDVDCGKIAKLFGGGGHKKAAGFRHEKLPFRI